MNQLQSTDNKNQPDLWFFDTAFNTQCGWGIEVLENPILGFFRMHTTILRGHSDIPDHNSILGEDL